MGKTTNLTPRQIVEKLDQYIIGQKDAKKAVAVALRNRYRRGLLNEKLREEIIPKNILNCRNGQVFHHDQVRFSQNPSH